jgi:hypothetical protein
MKQWEQLGCHQGLECLGLGDEPWFLALIGFPLTEHLKPREIAKTDQPSHRRRRSHEV